MKAAELADKLEKDGMSVLHYSHYDLLSKSLRFAADMEKIYEHCGGEIVIRKRKEPQQEIEYLSGSVTRSKGDDIYSAARNAVEELEERR